MSRETRQHQPSVAAIVVCFHPSLEHLAALLNTLSDQVQLSFVVDNGDDQELAEFLDHRSHGNEQLVRMSGNMGIGAAQNAGIVAAREMGFDYALLLDHDSLPLSGMVDELLRSMTELRAQGIPVAAVGPAYLDERQGPMSVFVRASAGRLRRVLPKAGENLVEVDHLIASGSLIPMQTLDSVGLMDESLFIDYVDVEWCLRASHRGFRAFGNSHARMKHSLGDAPVRFLGRNYPSRSPLRHYYTFRNAVILTGLSYIPARWKFANGVATLFKFVFYSIFGQERLRQIAMMCLGSMHGVLGRRGPLLVRRKVVGKISG